MKAELAEHWDKLEDDLLSVVAAVPEKPSVPQQHVDMHNELLRQFETTRREHSESTRQLSDSVHKVDDTLEGLTAFDDLQQTVTTSCDDFLQCFGG